MTLVGVAGVVAVLLVVLSIGQGLEDVMQVSGAEDAVIAMRTGSDNEMSSSLDIDTLRAIAETPGIRRDTAGALLSAELVVVVDVPKASTGTDGPSSRITSSEIPPSSGVPGPGEMIMRSGRRLRTSSTVILSLR